MWMRLFAAFVIGTVAITLLIALAAARKIWRETGADALTAEARAEIRSQIALTVLFMPIMWLPLSMLGGLLIAFLYWGVIQLFRM